MFSALVLAGLALLFRSAWLARAGVLSIPAALAAALLISALGGSRPAGDRHRARGAHRRRGARSRAAPLPAVVTGFLALYLIVLAAWPEVNALAIVGPHPDGGGRFYGITNEVETLLLAPVLVAATAWFWPVAALALANVAWSKAGADGGGILVFAVGLATLRLRLAGRALTVRGWRWSRSSPSRSASLSSASTPRSGARATSTGPSAGGPVTCSACSATGFASPGTGSRGRGTRR